MIRASVRLLLLVAWSLVIAPLPLLAGLGGPRATARFGPWLLRVFSLGVCVILGIRVRRTGALPLRGPCLVAPNHWGYVDVFVLGSQYRTLFVSRADVADWPVFGWFARAGGTLFIRREVRRDASRVGGEIERLLRRRCRVTTFLEGGSGSGIEVRPFKSALVESAVAAHAPCVPVAIRYRLPASPDLDPSSTVAWIDGGFAQHLWRLMHVPRIDADVAFLPPRTGTDRKQLTRQLENDVRAAISAPARTPDPRACTR